MEKTDEENELEPTGESNNSQETDEGGDTNNNSDSSSDSSEQGNESLSFDSSGAVLVSEIGKVEGENIETGDQDREGNDQDGLERAIEKELDKYFEEEAEFIKAYHEMVGKERALDEVREREGESRQMTDEEWEKEVEIAAYNAKLIYESMEETGIKIPENKEDLEIEKEVEQSEEISEPQLSDLKEEVIEELVEKQYEETELLKEQEGKEVLEAQASKLKEDIREQKQELEPICEGKEPLEQHQVEPYIKEALETEQENIIKEKELEQYQELELEEQFKTINFNEYVEELVEKQEEETEQLKEQEEKEALEAQASKIKEANSELYEVVEVERDKLDQHEVEATIEEELETKPEPIIIEKEVEKLQELDIEEQFQMIHLNEYVDELVEKQVEDKNIENDKIEQEKENIEQTQEVIHQSTYLQEKLEEQEEELEWEYEEKDKVEQHQVEASIEEELKTEPKPIVNEEELEYIKSLEPEKQLEAELFYEFIEELANKQNEEQEEREENEEQEEISTEQKVAQIMRELDIPQEINAGETEVETNSQEGELEQETTSPDEEVVEQLEIEESKDHQQELEEILEQVRKIEQEALNEIEQEEEDLDKTIEKNYERVKKLYKQQTGKRPIYANKETKGFKQWLEQKKKSEEKEKTKQKKELKEEQKKEEGWKTTLKRWIKEASEEECNAELKSELKKALESYNEFEYLTRKFLELYKKSQHEKLTEIEKNRLKSLMERLQELGPIQLELLTNIRAFKDYFNNHFWELMNRFFFNRVRSKFFKHISQKYKELRKEQKKKGNLEEILKNWIDQASEEEISPELKVLLKEIVENYNELEELATMFMKLYTKAQREKLSKNEKHELKLLMIMLQKLEPGKIELFSKIRAIKNYLNDQNFDDFSKKTRVNRLLNRFFAHLEKISYNIRDLIEDLRSEIQQFSEELAQIFPNRLLKERGNKYSHSHLSQLWEMSDSYVRSGVIASAKQNSEFIICEKALLQLQEKLEEKLSVKAQGCFQIIRRYQSKEINTLQFVDMLEKELGRVSGEIKVTNEELSLILAGTHQFIQSILSRMTQLTHRRYNPHYKFSKEVLSEFRASLFEMFGYRARNCFDNLRRYEHLNPDLKEYSKQQYTIKNPHYFLNIEKKRDASYWFGFLRADGSRGGAPYTIAIELAEKDIKTLEGFAKKIGFPLDRIETRAQYRLYKGKLKEYKSARIKFVCRLMAQDIDNLGFQSSKADQKFVPDYIVQALKEAKRISKQTNIDWWLTLPGKVALAFLLGFYDGDGTYRGGRSARIYASSKQFLEHIKELFDIKNKVFTAMEPGEETWVLDRKCVSKGFYSLALGPKLYDMMINSYKYSMKRKRPLNPTESLNFIGDQI